MREEIKVRLLQNLLEEVTKKYDYFLSQREAILQETYRLSITDELTGLYNRHYALHRLEEEIERSLRENTSFTVIMIDLDNFKPINDKYGHAKGDEVLREIGCMLKTGFRAYDIAARIGGDEFVIIVFEHNDIKARVEKIKEQIESLIPDETLSFSYGVVSFPRDFEDIIEEAPVMKQKILSKVDALMYENKRKKKA